MTKGQGPCWPWEEEEVRFRFKENGELVQRLDRTRNFIRPVFKMHLFI